MESSETLRNGWLKAGLLGLVLGLTVTLSPGCAEEDPVDQTPGEEEEEEEETGNDGGMTPPTDGGVVVPDTDIAIVRLNSDGTVDTTYGTNGIAKVDFGTGAGTTRDSVYGIDKDADDRIVLFGQKKAEGRSDADRVVARLTTAGAVDTTFATSGFHTLDSSNVTDNARNGFVQADGKILASGYAPMPTGVGTQAANRIVLLRLNSDGTPDNTFGEAGVVRSAPFMPADPATTEWGMAEAYGATLQNGRYVTTGYGRAAASGQVDVVSCRYDADGELDTTFGTDGVHTLDLVGDQDRGRNLLTLADGRVMVVGSGTVAAGDIDALVAILDEDGELDPTFDTDGYKLYDFNRPEAALFGVAKSVDGAWIAATGHVSGGTDANDDSLLLLLPFGAGVATPFAGTVPVSATENDRFLAAAFDAQGRVYAAGYSTSSGDTSMIVARFDTLGQPDMTFGTNGVVTVNVVTAGNLEAARGIAIQSDGKIVIAGHVEKP